MIRTKQIKIGNRLFDISTDDNSIDKEEALDYDHVFRDIVRMFTMSTDVVIDIGSNIGLTSLLFSTMAKQVISFEANRRPFKSLLQNVLSNNVTNVQCVNIGLSDTEKQEMIFFSEENYTGAVISDTIKSDILLNHMFEWVKLQTLEQALSELKYSGPVNIIKIDVEGMEMKVLKGALPVIEKHKPIVMIEMNHFCLNVFQRTSIPEYIDFLKTIFPVLYAVDENDRTLWNLYDEVVCYQVMYQHILNFKFVNIVAAFNKNQIIQ